jgi:hypothetical protein
MRHAFQSSLLAAALAGISAAAQAAPTASAFVGPNSSSATQSCDAPSGPTAGTTFATASQTCSRADVGTASASATAATGHVAISAHADSHNHDSLFAEDGAGANFIDTLTFSSATPGATTAVVSANFLLDGRFEALNNAGGQIRAALIFTTLGLEWDFRALDNQDGFQLGQNNFGVEGGSIGANTNVRLSTGEFVVPLNSPVLFRLLMEGDAAANGPDAHGLTDFGAHSFKFAATPFDLPEGVTVNAGDYIVDNRFIDPLAVQGVPEPAGWALMIAGFGFAGALLRRRRALAA